MPLVPIMKVHNVSGVLMMEEPEEEHNPLDEVHMWMADHLDESDWIKFGPAAHIAMYHQRGTPDTLVARMKQLLRWWSGLSSVHTRRNPNLIYIHTLHDIDSAHRSYHNNLDVHPAAIPHDHPFT